MNEVEYVNGFSCAIDEVNGEAIIVLRRAMPVIDDSGDFAGVEEEVVGTLVMTSTAAHELYSTLGEILGQDEETLY